MSSQANTPDGALSRRRFMKIGAAGTAGAVGLGGAGPHVPSATQDAEAIAPVVLVGGAALAVGAGVNIGWAVNNYNLLGADETTDGLSGDALVDSGFQTVRTRESTNASTFIDNQNIIDTGLKHAVYGDAKVAAIEEINNEATKSAVKTAATDDIDAYETTVKTNFLKTWNESLSELEGLYHALLDHTDVPDAEHPVCWVSADGTTEGPDGSIMHFDSTRTVTMPDGSDFQVKVAHDTDKTQYDWDPVEVRSEGGWDWIGIQYNANRYSAYSDYDTVNYLRSDVWSGLYSSIDQTFTTVRDNILLWVDNVYSEVQAGELNTEDLLTSRELANMSADQEDFNQAIADLQALNISTNLEREATVKLDDGNITLKGQLATTGDTTISTGTVDPSADDFSYYFTYDVSQGEGVWNDYVEGIDGGVVTFTSEPYESTEFDIHTTASETATVSASAFTETDAGGEWTVDVSDQLETPITNIDSVNFYADVAETQYETVQLQDTFEVVTFTDTETGEEYDETEHTSEEAHDDQNYITEEEWNSMEERQKELIELYNEDSSGGGGGGGLLPEGEGGIVGLLAIAALGGAALLGR